ncbi:hypothetical protein H0V99_02055 [Candidatus Saccharibacteria bacterium]|nr:hypothetical protein [Candidatus Saccharibacteria bacterium]
MTPPKNKESVYIDVDDEITNIIEKVKTSESKIVALVLPKRATVLQSVVNMKLLKKAALSSKKSIVLITSEVGLLPLAGAAGLHVAKSLQSKPVIPPMPKTVADDDEVTEDIGDEVPIDATTSVGTLAAAAAIADDDDTETIELDNIDLDGTEAGAVKKGMAERLKHLKVPNFERFRLVFFLAGLGLLLLVGGLIMAFIIMPKAHITIKTDTTSVVSSFDFIASANVAELNIDEKKIPAVYKEVIKKDSEKAPATGQKDTGTKATGTMTLKNCAATEGSVVVPVGTRFTNSGLSFASDEAVTLPESSFSSGGTCKTDTRSVDVTAESPGDNYNLSSRTYTSNLGSVTASGSAMSGGTTNIIKIVSQGDIDAAVAKMKSRLDKQAVDELKALMDTEQLFTLNESKFSTEPKIASTPALDHEATEFTVTSETTYSTLGIKREYLSQVIASDVEDKIDTQKQAITNDGIDTAIFRLNNLANPKEAFISFRTSVVAGPELDEVAIKEAVRGKKRGQVESYISSQPGVKEVIVEYSPFWIYSTPKSTKKIQITIEKTAETQAEQAADGSE